MRNGSPGGKRQGVTIKDVAVKADVSRATVSRAFSHPHLLNSGTVARVRAAAQHLGYVPNHTARALSTGKAGNIALVVPDVTNPFFAMLMRGAQAAARDCGYATFLGDSDETETLEDILLSKLIGQVEGFVISSPRLSRERVLDYAERKPSVLVNRDMPGVPRVLVNDAASFEQAVEHLAELGHTEVAYIAGPPLAWTNSQRLRAVTRATKRLGLALVKVATARPSFEAGEESAETLIEAGVTAAIAFDDVMAQGVMAGMARHGLSVPGDFSVIGCDGVLATKTYPQLTSVETDCFAVGQKAVGLLVDILAGKSTRPAKINVPTRLTIRATTAAPRTRAVGRAVGKNPGAERRTGSKHEPRDRRKA